MPKLTNHPGKVWRGAPNIGMDNTDILTELGYSQEQIEKMYSEGLLDSKEYFEP